MHIRANIEQQGHHVRPIVLHREVERLLVLVHDPQPLAQHSTIGLDQRPNRIWLVPCDRREDIQLCAPT